MHDTAPVRSASSFNTPAPHVLTFRVMRLTTPLPCRSTAMPFVVCKSADPLLSNIPLWEGEGTPCGVGSLSVLPSSFGSIYASETFRSFISVFNRSSHSAQSVSVSIHMQTSSQRRIELFDSTKSPRSSLEPRASINNVVKVALPELGVHVLVCAASYRDPTSSAGQVRTLRQFFRFNVLPPLEPSLSVLPLYRGLESFSFATSAPQATVDHVHYLVDLRVLNAVPVPVYVTNATFVPKKPFRARALLRESPHSALSPEELADVEETHAAIPEARHASMGVGDARNFLFHVFRSIADTNAQAEASPSRTQTPPVSRLRRTDRALLPSRRPKPSASIPERVLTSAEQKRRKAKMEEQAEDSQREIGHLTISWRSALGELGHLDNVVVACEPFIENVDVEVAVVAVPQQIRTHHPFVTCCAARNNSNKAMRLYLQIRRDLVGEIVPMGVSGVPLGEVLPGATVRCNITMLPLARGLHSLTGVRVVDVDSNASYKAEAPVITVS